MDVPIAQQIKNLAQAVKEERLTEDEAVAQLLEVAGDGMTEAGARASIQDLLEPGLGWRGPKSDRPFGHNY